MYTEGTSPGGSEGSAYNAGDPGLISGLERSFGEGNGNPLQYSCLGNHHGQRSLAGYSLWGPKELDITEQLKCMYTEAFLQMEWKPKK